MLWVAIFIANCCLLLLGHWRCKRVCPSGVVVDVENVKSSVHLCWLASDRHPAHKTSHQNSLF